MNETGLDAQAPLPPLAEFVRALRQEGRAAVVAAPLLEVQEGAETELKAMDDAARGEAACPLPQYSPEAAMWATRLLYRLAQAVACREMTEEYIAAFCRIPCPVKRGPEADWSADLTLRHLPRLASLARHLSNADPLLAHLRQLGREWPLSSVGLPDLGELQLGSFWPHRGLRRIYLDRVALAGEDSRLEAPEVAAALRTELKFHPDLCPPLARKLLTIA